MFLYIVGGLFLFCLFILLFGLFVQLLWNVTVASMFSLTPISFWQAIGIFILAKLLFGFGAGTTNSVRRRSRSKRKHSKDDPESDEEDVSDLANDKEFSSFWDEEGREAYKAFRARSVNDDEDKPA
jgi:uncharacterized membrane protein